MIFTTTLSSSRVVTDIELMLDGPPSSSSANTMEAIAHACEYHNSL